MSDIKHNDKVRITMILPIDCTGLNLTGMTGIVKDHDDDPTRFDVLMDEHVEELDEWDNRLHFSYNNNEELFEPEHYLEKVED
jgi:hypothetical protein